MPESTPGRKTKIDRTPDVMFGQVLHRIRLQREMTQEQLAWEIGTERSFISDLERGVKGASVDMLFRLSKGLGVTPSALIQETEHLVKTSIST